MRDPLNRIDLLDVPALARFAGVPVIVSEFGWSSDDAGVDAAGRVDGAGDRGRALHARASPASSSGASTTIPVPLGVTPDPWVRFGWLDATGQPKPVFHAAFDALRAPLDCTAVAQAAGAPAGWPLLEHDPVPRRTLPQTSSRASSRSRSRWTRFMTASLMRPWRRSSSTALRSASSSSRRSRW